MSSGSNAGFPAGVIRVPSQRTTTRTRTQGIDLELTRVRPGRWVLRAFGGDGSKSFAVGETLAELEPVAIALARVLAASINADGSCELFWRHASTGVIRKRNTYGTDPRVSVG